MNGAVKSWNYFYDSGGIDTCWSASTPGDDNTRKIGKKLKTAVELTDEEARGKLTLLSITGV